MTDRKRMTAREILAMKQRGERVVMLTAYDYPTALLADAAGVDMLLVGDSLGMVVLGYETTLPVTLDEILHHTRAVCRANTKALVVADLPFLTYHVGEDEAMRNAGRLVKEGGASAVKLEGGAEVAPVVRRLVSAGIPVVGHLGLTPQSVNLFGGFRVQARNATAARKLLEDARALEAAGAFAVVLELVPSEVSEAVTKAVSMATIGIGAGPRCDGEVQVLHDLLGLYEGSSRRHAKCYLEAGRAIREALIQYTEEVRRGEFPAEANTVHAPELEDAATWEG